MFERNSLRVRHEAPSTSRRTVGVRRAGAPLLLAALLLLFVSIAASAQSDCAHPTPTLTTPADGSGGVSSPVTFTWTAVSGALGYEVWASFASNPFTELGGTSDTTFVQDVDPGTAVEWYVVTNFAECKNQSPHATFTTMICNKAAATLLSPVEGETGVSSPVTFQWTGVEGASGYRIWSAKGDDEFDVLDETTLTSRTIRLEPGTYVWYVEAFFDNCDSTFSSKGHFTIRKRISCPVTGPQLLTPASNAQAASPVDFSWSAVPGANAYQLWAALDDGDFTLLDEVAATSATEDIGDGHVRWYVSALFDGCDDVASGVGEFDIPHNPACDHDTTLLISPADGDRDVPLHVTFLWTPVAGAASYRVWVGYGQNQPSVIGQTVEPRLIADVAEGEITWFVDTLFDNCGAESSPPSTFAAAKAGVCRLPDAPFLFVDPEAMSGVSYSIVLTPGLNTQSYELEEATKADFSDAVAQTLTVIDTTITHSATVATRYYYRVRPQSSCGLGFGPYSDVATVVVPPTATDEENANAVTAYGSQSIVLQTIHIPGSASSSAKTRRVALAGQTFTVTVDQPWLTVSPSSGSIPSEGLDLTVKADPKTLPAGTSTATIHLTTTTLATTTNVPVNVNLVTPVSPNAGNSPIPQSLIIPAVAHVDGFGAKFESDVRLANTSAQTMKYQLNFTPSNSDGTKVGQQSTIQVAPGETAALNDVLKNFYGYAASGDSISGVLEIRPLASGSVTPNVTFVSSRTFAATSNGTYGQFIPGIPFSQFIGKVAGSVAGPAVLSLQQVAQSAGYRTNLGLVEGAGLPVTVQVQTFRDDGTLLDTFMVDLKPGEQRQLGGFLASRGLTNVNDGRLEVSVAAGAGKVTAYASVLDTKTNDPMLILPVNTNVTPSTRFVLPPIPDLTPST